jgi:hypothetical protein
MHRVPRWRSSELLIDETERVTQTWEYRVWSEHGETDPSLTERLDAWGLEGWELVAVVPHLDSLVLFFKRPFAD